MVELKKLRHRSRVSWSMQEDLKMWLSLSGFNGVSFGILNAYWSRTCRSTLMQKVDMASGFIDGAGGAQLHGQKSGCSRVSRQT